MEPIRILHMIGSLNIGGSQSMVLNLYRAMNREKIQFDFVIDHPNELELADEIEALGGRIYTMPRFNGMNFLQIRRAWEKFFANHTEYRILHSHVRSYASLFLPIAKKHGVKTIIHSHSMSNGTGLMAIYKSLLQFPLRFQADYFFSCSKAAGEWLFGKYVIQSPNYFMIPNGIDIEKFLFNAENRMRLRSELGIPEEAMVIGHVGRFHEAKNHCFLIQVFYEVLKRDDTAKLVLVGDGDLRSSIEKQCVEFDIMDKVFFVGAQADTAQYYSAFDVFLFPSKWEGLPVSVIEAQVAGLYCLLADTVTKEVCLTEPVENLSLELCAETWSEQIINRRPCLCERFSEERTYLLKSFDVKKTGQWIQDFYLGLL